MSTVKKSNQNRIVPLAVAVSIVIFLKARLQRHNSTQLDVELLTRSQREQLSPISSERRDPVDSLCR